MEKVTFKQYDDVDIAETTEFKTVASSLFKWHNFSLREIEQALRILILMLNSNQEIKVSWAPLASVLIVLKLKNPELYLDYIHKRGTVVDVVDWVIPVLHYEKDNKIYAKLMGSIYATYLSFPFKTEQDKAIYNLIDIVCNNDHIPEGLYYAKSLQQLPAKNHAEFIIALREFSSDISKKRTYNRKSLLWIVNKIDLLADVVTE